VNDYRGNGTIPCWRCSENRISLLSSVAAGKKKRGQYGFPEEINLVIDPSGL